MLTGVVASAAGLLVERQRLLGAADSAALAAADTAAGRRAGQPCDEARLLASLHGAALDGCLVDGATVTVRLRSIGSPVPIRASATAGRPTANTSGSIAGSEK